MNGRRWPVRNLRRADRNVSSRGIAAVGSVRLYGSKGTNLVREQRPRDHNRGEDRADPPKNVCLRETCVIARSGFLASKNLNATSPPIENGKVSATMQGTHG